MGAKEDILDMLVIVFIKFLACIIYAKNTNTLRQ